MHTAHDILKSKGHEVHSVRPDDTVLAGLSSKDAAVRVIMTSQVVCVAPNRTVDECMGIMTEKRVRHLPVVEHKRVIGMISIGDLVKQTIADQEFTITQLQRYIVGVGYG